MGGGSIYPVNEIFPTIQGEGRWAGTPGVFVRLQGCDVGFPWCDTKNTWHLAAADETDPEAVLAKTSSSPTWGMMDVLAIAARVQLLAGGARLVVITGGEPCTYDLIGLASTLIGAGFGVQVETSGTYEVRCHPKAWITVSPKIDMPGGRALDGQAIDRADEIKFVIGKPADLAKLDALIRQHGVSREKVWLQPVSMQAKATALCVQTCLERGYRLSVQAHKVIGVR